MGNRKYLSMLLWGGLLSTVNQDDISHVCGKTSILFVDSGHKVIKEYGKSVKNHWDILLQGTSKVESRNVTTPDTLMDLIRQMFPPNLIQVCRDQTHKTRKTLSRQSRHSRYPDTGLGIFSMANILGCIYLEKKIRMMKLSDFPLSRRRCSNTGHL